MRAIYAIVPVLVLLTAAKSPDRQHVAPVPAAPGNQPAMATNYTISADRYFHVDDFADMGPDWAPLSGTKSLWCGRRPDPAVCWLAAGYPTNSTQLFESREIPANGYVQVDFLAKWAVEQSYDYIYLEERTNIHDWQHAATLPFSGEGLLSIGTVASPAGFVQFRIRVFSDGSFSGEDGGFTSPGSAIIIDSLYVHDGVGNMIDYQSFESEPVGAVETNDGDWIADKPLVVTSTADSGPGTLREAITAANATTSLNRIVFDIPGAGPHSIQLHPDPLPPITDYLVIDGFTQPGASANTNPMGGASNAAVKVELYGFGAGFMASGLVFQARGKVRGLAINHWGQYCVKVESNDVWIEGCYIGPDVSGLTSDGFTSSGLHLGAGAARVGGCSPAARNVISGTGGSAGVVVDGNFSWIGGNYIGVGADATTPLANTIGVRLQGNAQGNVVGARSPSLPQPEESNIFRHNYNFGILVDGSTPAGNRFVGNSMHEDFRAIELDVYPDPQPNGINVYAAEGSLISGHFWGTPNTIGRLHFYRSDECGGPWGTGYAEVYVGTKTQSSGPTGTVLFDYTLTQPIPPGCWITATATFAAPLNTSQLSVCRQYQNTPGGGSVTVDLLDDDLSALGTATYEEITAPGNTYVENPFEPPMFLTGPFSVPEPDNPRIYYDVTTDASFNGMVEVCLHYDELNLPGKEDDLVLVHFDGHQWVDVTSSHDTGLNTICGSVSSLSPFVIAVPIPTAAGDTPLPEAFALRANVPNPFNPITTIHYDVPAGGADVSISVYDVAGRQVRDLVNEHRAAGRWSVQWHGDDARGQQVASGVYFYRMRAGAFVETRKMVLLK